MEFILVFFSQVTFCVFKTLIIYTTLRGEKHKTAGISVILGIINLMVVYIGVRAIEDGDVMVVLSYLAGNYIGTWASTRQIETNDY